MARHAKKRCMCLVCVFCQQPCSAYVATLLIHSMHSWNRWATWVEAWVEVKGADWVVAGC